MPAQYDYWNEKKDNIKDEYNHLPREDYTQELRDIYRRHIDIINEILEELQHEFNDEQYTETTSWRYEKELEELEKKAEELAPIIKEKVEAEEHKEFLKDIGMTQEQYDEHLKSQSKSRGFPKAQYDKVLEEQANAEEQKKKSLAKRARKMKK